MRHHSVLVRRAVKGRWGRPMRGQGRILGGRGLEGIQLSLGHGAPAERRGRFGRQEGGGVLRIRTVHERMLGERRWGRGAAVRRHAGGRSYRTGHQQRGGVMEEGSEEARDFLKLLTDGGDLTGEGAHLGRANQKFLSHHPSGSQRCHSDQI